MTQVVVLRDISQLKAANEALQRSHEQLERRVQQRTEELAGTNEALQAEIAERKQAEKVLVRRTRELSRSNAFITALSKVAVRLASVSDPDEVMSTLGVELKTLRMTCLVAMLEQDRQSLVIRHSSVEPALLAAGERLVGFTMRGFAVPRERFTIWGELIDQGRAVFVPDPIPMVSAALPSVLPSIIQRVFQLGGGRFSGPSSWLPLMVGKRVTGGLAVWGPTLKETDIPALSVFAGQVATALENARLHAVERERSQALARTGQELQTELEEHRRTAEQLQVSLQEKEVLLQEVHHRVKNNLEIISSLLYLQSVGVRDEALAEMLRDSRNRVRSIAMVHEKLLRSPSLAKIDFGEYARSLGGSLFKAFAAPSDDVGLTMDVDDVFLSLDTAIPCGLLINELVSNALKHAFPGGIGGEIRVALHRDGDGKLALEVNDDGVGLPEDVTVRRAETLGLQLVHTLVEQLRGSLEVDTSRGTQVRISFAAPDG
jgi:two-component sensor histidine kinase